MTLMELTNQESGIVIYGDEIIVANWSGICPNGGLPMMAPANLGLIAWPKDIIVINEYWVDDIRTVLPGAVVESGIDEDGNTLLELDGMDIISDDNGDICALWGYDIGAGSIINRDAEGNLVPTTGKIYELADGEIVIAPDGWC